MVSHLEAREEEEEEAAHPVVQAGSGAHAEVQAPAVGLGLQQSPGRCNAASLREYYDGGKLIDRCDLPQVQAPALRSTGAPRSGSTAGAGGGLGDQLTCAWTGTWQAHEYG